MLYRRNIGSFALGLLCAALACVRVAAGDTLQVPSAYSTIQDAVNAANSGDEIVVAPGTYSGTGFRDINLGAKELVIRGTARDDAEAYCGEDMDCYWSEFWSYMEDPNTETVLDLGGVPGDPHRAFVIELYQTNATAIEGFTIRNGYIDPNSDGVYGGSSYGLCNGGGAIRCNSASPTIQGNILENNEVHQAFNNSIIPVGGAIFCSQSDAVITHNQMRSNQAVRDFGVGCASGESCHTVARGGAVACYDCNSPVIAYNSIENNLADGNWMAARDKLVPRTDRSPCGNVQREPVSGPMQTMGGGIWVAGGQYSHPQISYNSVLANAASATTNDAVPYLGGHNVSGGGIYSSGQYSTIEGNTISENSATVHFDGPSGGVFHYASGGGLTISDWWPEAYTNNVITHNRAEVLVANPDSTCGVQGIYVLGGGAYVPSEPGSPTLANNVISWNTARVVGTGQAYSWAGGGGVCTGRLGGTFLHNRIEGNSVSADSGSTSPTPMVQAFGGGVLGGGLFDGDQIIGNTVDVNCPTDPLNDFC